MKMKHDFKAICYNIDELMEGVGSLSKFMDNLNKQSPLYPERWPEETYKGKGFEFLIEVLIKYSTIDKRINICDYEPVLKSDYGIDGIGQSHNGRPHTMQAKYRSNTAKSLTANEDHISNFVAKSLSDYGPKVDMTVFTTAKDLMSVINENMYADKVRVIGYKELTKLINKNKVFWKLLKKHLEE